MFFILLFKVSICVCCEQNNDNSYHKKSVISIFYTPVIKRCLYVITYKSCLLYMNKKNLNILNAHAYLILIITDITCTFYLLSKIGF